MSRYEPVRSGAIAWAMRDGYAILPTKIDARHGGDQVVVAHYPLQSVPYPGFEISDNASPADLISAPSVAISPKATIPTNRLSAFMIGKRLI